MRRSKALGELILSRAGRYRKEVKVAEEGDRYILCYNPYRAEEDRKAREAIVAQLKAVSYTHLTLPTNREV